LEGDLASPPVFLEGLLAVPGPQTIQVHDLASLLRTSTAPGAAPRGEPGLRRRQRWPALAGGSGERRKPGRGPSVGVLSPAWIRASSQFSPRGCRPGGGPARLVGGPVPVCGTGGWGPQWPGAGHPADPADAPGLRKPEGFSGGSGWRHSPGPLCRGRLVPPAGQPGALLAVRLPGRRAEPVDLGGGPDGLVGGGGRSSVSRGASGWRTGAPGPEGLRRAFPGGPSCWTGEAG
jgi:hypothetical protein